MQIRAGYEISYECPRPTPMILQLSVHSTRRHDLLSWDRVRMDPAIPVNTYHDGFGNFCHVITAPVGRTTFSADFTVRDSGMPDPVAPEPQQAQGFNQRRMGFGAHHHLDGRRADEPLCFHVPTGPP